MQPRPRLSIAKRKTAEAAESLLLLLAVVVMCALETMVLAYPIAKARWGGWRLVGTVFDPGVWPKPPEPV